MSKTNGITISVTAETNAGSRRHMEDYLAVRLRPNEEFLEHPHLREQAYIGVFDGHGGKEAAKCARERLWDIIQNQPKYKLSDIKSIKESLEGAFIALHREMEPLRASWKRNKNGDLSTAGTTASTIIFRQDHIFVANVGDSTAILAVNNPKRDQPNQHQVKAVVLTKDHKPEDPDETKNIENLGGSVMTSRKGVPRVVWRRQRKYSEHGLYDSIPFLSVSRSLGDFWSFCPQTNRFTVSPKPDVYVYPLNPKEQKFVVIASDGLWNVMSPDEVVQFIWDYEHDNQECHQPHDVVRAIISEALRRWERKRLPADNIAVLIAFLSESKEEVPSLFRSLTQSSAPNKDNEDASIAQEVSPSSKAEINAEVKDSPPASPIPLSFESETGCFEEKMSNQSIFKTRQCQVDKISRNPLASCPRLSPVGKHSREEDTTNTSPILKRSKLDHYDSGCYVSCESDDKVEELGDIPDVNQTDLSEDSGSSGVCSDEVSLSKLAENIRTEKIESV